VSATKYKCNWQAVKNKSRIWDKWLFIIPRSCVDIHPNSSTWTSLADRECVWKSTIPIKMRLDKCPGRLVTCYYYYGLSIALLLIILSLLQSAECYSSQPSQKVTTHRRYSSDKQSSYFQNPLCNSVKCKSTNNIASTKLKSPKTTSKLSFPGLVTSTPRSSSLLAIHDIHELKDLMKKKRKKCKGVNYKGFECQKVKWYMWLVNEFDNNVTEVTPWIELLRNEDLSDLAVSQSELVGLPETWYDKLLHKLVTKWGGPIDQFMFQKYKEYVTSRELKLKVPIIGEVKMSPRVHSVAVTGRSTPRWFWDPGFNLKLKLPFFKDELSELIFVFQTLGYKY